MHRDELAKSSSLLPSQGGGGGSWAVGMFDAIPEALNHQVSC